MSESLSPVTEAPDRVRRWRLVLGADADDGDTQLSGDDAVIDGALSALYDFDPESRKLGGGLGGTQPRVARWLGDIRRYFKTSVVQVMQKDALERLDLRKLLLEPELLEAAVPDVHLVANLMALSGVIPTKTKATARLVVQRVVDDLVRRVQEPMRQAVTGSLNRAARNRRPKHVEIDWNRTIRANLKHYQLKQRTIIPETRIGFGRKRSAMRDIMVVVDQSGSMATSVVYSSIFAAVLASIPAVRTHLIAYDESVVDLTDTLHSDPVDVLFGAQLGGGNDTPKALRYTEGLIGDPTNTVVVLISDLYEFDRSDDMCAMIGKFVQAGIKVVALLALNDDGAPSFDHNNAARFAAMGVPAFACTPDLFPDLMAAALRKDDLNQWAAAQGIVTQRGEE